jgi:glycosyltransferase involved in cell wall biosynthesis
MKILQLCKKFPFPLRDGESIAVSSMSKALSELGCEVSLLAMNTTKHHTDLEKLPEDFSFFKEIRAVEVDNQVRAWPALKNIFSTDSFHISRFVSETYKQELIDILQKDNYDIIQLETLYLTPYLDTIKKYSKAIVVMRAHNIESEIWERITENTEFLPKKIYLEHLTKKLKNYELQHLNDYDYLVTVSDRDLAQFKKLGYKNGAMSSPIGLNLKSYAAEAKTDEYDIGFIGTMDWRPNEEGVEWFIQKVFPLIQKENKEAKLHIAGRSSGRFLKEWSSDRVIVHGEVESASAFMSQCKLMMVPLFSGSGTRVKILEAMAMKKAIVSTSIGIEGIEATNEKHVLIKNEPQAFADAILHLLNDKEAREDLGNNAYDFVTSGYDNLALAKKLLDKYKSLLASDKYASVQPKSDQR